MYKKMIIALTIFPLFANAQTKTIQNVTTGIVYNSQMSFLKDASVSNTSFGYGYKSKYSYGFGLDFVLAFNDKIKLSTGLFYNSKKFERTDYCYTCDVEYTPVSDFKMSSFTIPANIWYYFTDKRLDIYAIAGINNYFSAKVREYRVSYSGKIDEFNSKDDFKRLAIGLNGGIGLNYNLTYRLSAGLNSIYTFNPGNFGISPELKMNFLTLQTVLYYRF